jgi:hypothetical protein
MLFEMPVEISGKKNSLVFCSGTVVRSATKPRGEAGGVDLAIAISDYKFVHENVSSRPATSAEMVPVAPRFRAKCHAQRRRER